MKYNFDEIIDRNGTNSAKVDEMNQKYGTDMMHFGVADMDFKSPAPIIKTLEEVVKKGVFGYSNMPNDYSEYVVNWMRKRYNCNIDKDWVLFSPRIMFTFSLVLQEFTKQGDGIILNSPSYSGLRNTILNNNCEVIESPLEIIDGCYTMNLKKLESKMNERVKIFVLCSPHNPTCRVWSKKELDELADFCIKHNLLIFSDEIHGDIISKQSKHIPILNVNHELSERAILCTSVTKSLNVPGIILSNAIVPNQMLRNRLKQAINKSGIHNPNIFAAAIAKIAYSECDEWLEEVNHYIRDNYNMIRSFINTYLPGFILMPSEGTYFAWIDYKELAISEKQMEEFFIKKAKVSVYMGSEFSSGGEGYFRLNLATSRAYLQKALYRIRESYHLIYKQYKN